METTVSEYSYKSFKYKVMSACYNAMHLGYNIGADWGVECHDQLSWSATGSKDVCPLSAYLLNYQPPTLRFDYDFDRFEWDTHEVTAVAYHCGLPENFVSAVSMGYQFPHTPWRELMKDYTDLSDRLVDLGMPPNVVENEENFRLGIKLGKFLADHFGFKE